ncbi:hypothetical protein B0H16DRAFT_1721084 [Mycena metata]|uniref:Uncharacterized protein n=1 Tax=Mycena metata TaxID=1033252 RepID=A0AAD7NFF2_9AGAR|nr:hypothetical protein B0H16DRAFT_1721084 [Mycena metata]
MLKNRLYGAKNLCLGPSREFASLPVRRARRFWDFHVPEGAWGYRPRDTKKLWAQPSDFHERARNWVSVPDANLPAPWSCNWSYWPYAAAIFEGQPVETSIAAHYALSDAPLTPVMFDFCSTVLACASTGKYYLCYGWRWPWPSEAMKKPLQPLRRAPVYAFEGVFPSLDAFIEAADWNRIERLELAGNANTVIEASSIAPALPLGSGRGFRVVAQEPYQKRTLWDMCPPPETFGHISRNPCRSARFPLALLPRMSEWPQIPDSALPEPWSADWPAFIVCQNWHEQYHVELEERFGRALMGFIPALFQPDDCRGDTVICPPGGAGTYYLWGSELRWDLGHPGPMPEMQRFRGVFASVEHFPCSTAAALSAR